MGNFREEFLFESKESDWYAWLLLKYLISMTKRSEIAEIGTLSYQNYKG